MGASVIPIWVENQFRQVRVRLIGGDAELLMGMVIVSESVTSTSRRANGESDYP